MTLKIVDKEPGEPENMGDLPPQFRPAGRRKTENPSNEMVAKIKPILLDTFRQLQIRLDAAEIKYKGVEVLIELQEEPQVVIGCGNCSFSSRLHAQFWLESKED